MTDIEPVIGLEVHAQLKTETKLFCNCSTQFGRQSNSSICPVCAAHPGALPVLNQKAVEFAVRVGLALNCTVNRESVFARKNYFYPDLPKGYQISQFNQPLCQHGHLDIETNGKTKRIGITRIHMEEDAGKLVHQGSASIKGATHSLVDLNRAGTPLIEIVSEPDLRSAAEARAFMEKLHALVVFLGVCDGNMEEGSLRADANVSLRAAGSKNLATRTETKNLNSFRFVEQAIIYEIDRQTEILSAGGTISQETRTFDSESGTGHSMRSKEEAHDYRYFPEPDLLPLILDPAWLEEIKKTQPKTPDQITAELETFGLSPGDIKKLLDDPPRYQYFACCCGVNPKVPAKKIANWVLGDLSALTNEGQFNFAAPVITASSLSALVSLIEAGAISGKIAKEIIPDLLAGKTPATIVEEKGLTQISNTDELVSLIQNLMAKNPGPVEQFKAGKESVAGFFVGQVMKQTQGRAKPDVVQALVKQQLGKI